MVYHMLILRVSRSGFTERTVKGFNCLGLGHHGPLGNKTRLVILRTWGRDGYRDAGVTWSQENFRLDAVLHEKGMRVVLTNVAESLLRDYGLEIDVTLGSLGEMGVDLETNGDQ